MWGPPVTLLTAEHTAATVRRLFPRRTIILVGHFGSGKSEIAVNLALAFNQAGEEVTLADLDLIKPYFRSRLAKDDLDACGIRLVAPEGDRFYADLPILVPEARGLARDGNDRRVIFDVGGSDLGARVLGSLAGLLNRETTDLLFVVNGNRPFADDAPACLTVLRDIQAAARMSVTGLVSNTHLMEETTPAMVRAGIALARDLSTASGVPLRCAMVPAPVFPACTSSDIDGLALLPMERYIVAPFAKQPSGSRRRADRL